MGANRSIALAFAVTLLAGCGSETDPRTDAPLVVVATARPAAGDGNSLSGIVAARVQSDLGFRVGGKVVQRYVDAGQAVRLGQPLMRLDNTDLALTAAQARRTADAAAAQLDLATTDERRVRTIAQRGFTTRRELDRAKSTLDAARADHAAARAQASIAGNASAYAVLRADADGVVMETMGEPGQVVAAGQPVVRLARNGPREAIVNVPEALRRKLGTDGSAEIYGVGGGFPARLRQLSAMADPATRTYEARYILSAAGASAPLGATVTITPRGLGGATGRVSVPIAAVYDPGSGAGVWVIDPRSGVVRFRRVHVAAMGLESATLDRGLRPGERIVGLGAHLLHEGQKVRTRD